MKCILILIDDDGAKENMWEGRSEFQLGTDINIEFLKGFYEYHTEKWNYRDVTCFILKLLVQ